MSIISKFFGLFRKKERVTLNRNITLNSLYASYNGFEGVLTVPIGDCNSVSEARRIIDVVLQARLNTLLNSQYLPKKENILYVPISCDIYNDFNSSHAPEDISDREVDYLDGCNVMCELYQYIPSFYLGNNFAIRIGSSHLSIWKFSDEWFLVHITYDDKIDFYYKCDTFDGVKELFNNIIV